KLIHYCESSVLCTVHSFTLLLTALGHDVPLDALFCRRSSSATSSLSLLGPTLQGGPRDPPGRHAARTSPHEPAHLVHGAARASTLAVLRSSRSSAQGARWRVAIRATGT